MKTREISTSNYSWNRNTETFTLSRKGLNSRNSMLKMVRLGEGVSVISKKCKSIVRIAQAAPAVGPLGSCVCPSLHLWIKSRDLQSWIATAAHLSGKWLEQYVRGRYFHDLPCKKKLQQGQKAGLLISQWLSKSWKDASTWENWS